MSASRRLSGRAAAVSARDDILAALGRAGPRLPAFDVPLPPLRDGRPRQGPQREGLTTQFAQRAVDVGTEVHVIGAADLPRAIVSAVVAEAGGEVVVWEDPLLDACAQALRGAGIVVIAGEGETQDKVAAASFGLTTVDHAIAETGTLVLSSSPGRSRSASLLPARHIAVLPEARIQPDLYALMREIRGPLSSALTFITGPSRTADIGLTTVRPAHGPVAVTVFVVSEAAAEPATTP